MTHQYNPAGNRRKQVVSGDTAPGQSTYLCAGASGSLKFQRWRKRCTIGKWAEAPLNSSGNSRDTKSFLHALLRSGVDCRSVLLVPCYTATGERCCSEGFRYV